MPGWGCRTVFAVGRRYVVGLVALCLVAGACSGGGGDDDGRTGPTVPPGDEVSTTTTTAPPGSTTTTSLPPEAYAVPDVIDQAYVQRVVSAYDKVLGDAIRAMVRDRGISDEFLKNLVAIYTQPQFEVQQRLWTSAVAEGDLDNRPAEPGDPVTVIRDIVRADQRCVIAGIDRDFRPTLRPDIEPTESEQPDYVVLVRKREAPDPNRVNPTPWIMSFDGFKTDGTVPVNSCDD
jgi:hypothetical protein